MNDLIQHHEPRLVGKEGEWTIWEYRGATVRSWGVCNKLVMPGHPLHEKTLGHYDSWFPIIDRWLDHGDLAAS
ncbi:hypothetical protein ACFQU7_37130 [Pseudoroseomonas wenyumeiae]